MGLSAERLRGDIDALAEIEPGIKRALSIAGYPETRLRERGYTTLLRTIVGQQVSTHAAAAVWRRLEEHLGDGCPHDKLLASEFDELRGCGLSRQKQDYARSLAEMVLSNTLDFDNLPEEDEEAILLLTKVKGIGRWSAEIYLLFAEGRGDIWPAGDLAVQEAVKRILGLAERPGEKETRALAEKWRPYRDAAAIFAWHSYNIEAI